VSGSRPYPRSRVASFIADGRGRDSAAPLAGWWPRSAEPTPDVESRFATGPAISRRFVSMAGRVGTKLSRRFRRLSTGCQPRRRCRPSRSGARRR
jgi:hypothetical protein